MDQHPPFLRDAAPLVPMRGAIPGKVDKTSRVPEEEKGVRGSQGGGKDKLFSYIALS